MNAKKRHIGIIAAVTAALIGGTVPAFASSTVTDTITTTNETFKYHKRSCASPDGSTMVIPGNRSNKITLVHKGSTTTLRTVSDPRVGDPDYNYYDPDQVGYIYRPIACAFSPDGLTVYVTNDDPNGYNDQGISIVDVATATATGYLVVPDNEYPVGIGVSPDNSKLLVHTSRSLTAYNLTGGTANLGKTSRNWYGDTGIVAWAKTDLHAYTASTMFYPDATTVRIVSRAGSIENINISDGTVSSTVKEGNMSSATEVHATGWCEKSDHSMLATTDGEKRVALINPTTGATVALYSFDFTSGSSELMNCTFTPTGDLLVTGTPDYSGASGQVYVLDGTTLNLRETISTPTAGYNYAIQIFADGTVFTVGSLDNIAVIKLDPKYVAATKKTKTAKASVAFAAKKSTLTAAAKKSLNSVAKKYKSGATKIVLTVNVPSATKAAKNTKASKKLATKRAAAIKAYLKAKGVKAKVTVKVVVVVTKGKKLTAKLKKSVQASTLVITYKG